MPHARQSSGDCQKKRLHSNIFENTEQYNTWLLGVTVIHRSSSAIEHFVVDENFTSFFGYIYTYICYRSKLALGHFFQPRLFLF